ncbi:MULTISPECIES: YhgE/Pip domain-containing protein [unclassified Bacillus (in: firmicutes)]|uniref:YhgE/Pip domain-containing protein n=1 Tax=unclassified Bacillus (in: firmicutes) TaxID=185979 RepID=UPI000BF21B25|nr:MULTISPECIES: ABC transporter permease [unclassified Bacillus (in: firmicutes)]PEJ56196.1 phage infection protein [Bacillus sp. AFS002410]PEL13888.1 phage infection protein [Bacillus sp. AFS017336]
MNLFKQKQAILAPILVLVVAIIFSLTLASSVNPTPKNLPIAIVNEDQGIQVPSKGTVNIGNMMVSKITELSKATNGEKPAIKWIQVSSEEKVRKGLDDQKYYGALILPNDLSKNQASLKTANPSPIAIKILVNQGKNTTGSTMASQMLTHIVENLSLNIHTEIFTELKKNVNSISVKQAEILANPLIAKIENVNAIGTHTSNGNAPVLLITPLWMSSLIGAVIVFLAKKKTQTSNKVGKLKVIFEQLFLGVILSFLIGFGITLMAKWMGITLPNFLDVALYLTIAYFCFHILISAVLSWIGFGGVGIFALIFFFSGSLIGMPKELLPAFSKDWIYSWVPMRFGADGLREIFYFDKGLSMSHPMTIIIWIGIISVLVLFLSAVKPNKEVLSQTEAVTMK